MSDVVAEAARAFFEARRDHQHMDNWPSNWVPQDTTEAYRIQDAVMQHEGPAGGWKVLAGAAGDPFCAPIPRSRYFESGARLDGAALMVYLTEVEVGVKLGRSLGAGCTNEQAEAAIVTVHPAIELCSSSFRDVAAAPELLKLSDLQSNGAVIVGAPVGDWKHIDFATLQGMLSYDGKQVDAVSTGASWQQIVAAVAWLANHVASRGLTLNEGDVIITGSRIKHAANPPQVIEATLAGIGSVGVELY